MRFVADAANRSHQAFDRRDVAAIGVDRQNRARAYRTTVEQERTGAANLNITAELCAGQMEFVAHQIQQRQPRLNLRAALNAIDAK